MGSRIFPSGVTLGDLDLSGTDDDGLDWHVSSLSGWSGSPASTLAVTQKAGGHGGWATQRPRLTARTLTVAGTITGSPRLVSAAVDKLNSAATLDPAIIVVVEGGRSRWATVQRSDEVIVDDSIAASASYSLQLSQPDPFKYGDQLTGSTGLPSTTGGLTIPTSIPFGITSAVVSGQVNMTNPGNANGPVTFRIDGPVAGPTITHMGSGLALVFSTALMLNAGEWLDVDPQRKTALLNGTASRAGWITSRGWSAFEPGPNTWAFSTPANSTTARLTVAATPAWL